jgi:hypothetical protein
MTEDSKVYWMVSFGIHGSSMFPPVFERVQVAKLTGKQATLVRSCRGSGYRTRVTPDELFESREEAVASVRVKCLEQAAALRQRADEFEQAIGLGDEP